MVWDICTPETASPEEDDVSPPEDSQVAPEVATATSFWRLANQALDTGISHARIRVIAASANGQGWAGAMAQLLDEMKKAA